MATKPLILRFEEVVGGSKILYATNAAEPSFFMFELDDTANDFKMTKTCDMAVQRYFKYTSLPLIVLDEPDLMTLLVSDFQEWLYTIGTQL